MFNILSRDFVTLRIARGTISVKRMDNKPVTRIGVLSDLARLAQGGKLKPARLRGLPAAFVFTFSKTSIDWL